MRKSPIVTKRPLDSSACIGVPGNFAKTRETSRICGGDARGSDCGLQGLATPLHSRRGRGASSSQQQSSEYDDIGGLLDRAKCETNHHLTRSPRHTNVIRQNREQSRPPRKNLQLLNQLHLLVEYTLCLLRSTSCLLSTG